MINIAVQGRSVLWPISIAFAVIVTVLIQVVSAWYYTGAKVDEAEMVLFGVGFLGGDLDPKWSGYGHLGMYLLGFVYLIVGCVSILLGFFENFTEYGSHFLSNGYFFILGRLVMATAIVCAILLCCKLLARFQVTSGLLLMFFLLASFSPSTVKYANYVRTDALVALFTVCLLYYSVFAKTYRDLLCATVLASAAVACKISALPLSAVLGILAIYLWLNKRVTFLQASSVVIVFLAFMYFLSPYMDYVSLFKYVLTSETGEALGFYRTHYDGVQLKLIQILDFHYRMLGIFTCQVALLGVFIGCFTRYRRTVIFTCLLIGFTILPYLFGATLREYWFLSSYLLVGLLAFIAIVIVLDCCRAGLSRLAFRVVLLSTIAGLTIVPLKDSLAIHGSYLSHFKNTPLTNKHLARQWLEKEHLGVSSILLDKNFSNVYPRLFDPAYLKVSRTASGMYGHYKDQNVFLSKIFEHHLYHTYLSDSDSSLDRSRFLRLKKLRLDFVKEASFAMIPKVCSYYSKNCYPLTLNGLHHVEVVETRGQKLIIRLTGDDPYMIFDVDGPISIDQSFYAKIETDAYGWQLYYDFGGGTSEELTSLYYYSSELVAISVPSIKPIVNYLGMGDEPRRAIDVDKRVLFVTSPSGYGRFDSLRDKDLGDLNDREKLGLALLNWHDDMTKAKLVRRFDGPSGSPIEIYDITEYSRGLRAH